MDPKLTKVTQLFARFKAPYARSDLDTCVTLLSQLKVQLTKFPSLPPLFQQTPNAVEELKLARDIYEHAVVLRVKLEDQDAFERDFCQLKPYYMDTWAESVFVSMVRKTKNKHLCCLQEKRSKGISPSSIQGFQAFAETIADEELRRRREETKRFIRRSYMVRLLTAAGGAAFSVFCVSTTVKAIEEMEKFEG